MTEKVFALDTTPGIQRDGTIFDKITYTDGRWVRFQRGRPRKVGGYSQITNQLAGPSRGIFQDSKNGQSRVFSGFENGLQSVTLNNLGVGSSISDFDFGGAILTLGAITSGGNNYSNGTYKNVSLTSVTGAGFGATANITVSGNKVTAVTIVEGGNGYVAEDILSADPLEIGTGIKTTKNLVGGSLYANGTYLATPLTGGTGTGATANIVVSGNAVTKVTINNRGVGYTVDDVLSAVNTYIGGSNGIIKTYGNLSAGQDYTAGTYTNVSFIGGSGSGAKGTVEVGTNAITSVYNIVSGSNYTDGTFADVPFTGGAGTGATGTITVSGGNVVAITVTYGGNNYVVDNVLSASAAKIGNAILTAAVTNVGSGYVDGVYANVPLTTTTGTGSLALATITISGGTVVDFVIEYGGIGYAAADTLSASNTDLGGSGSGFVMTVSTVASSSGFQCQVSTVQTGGVTKVTLTSNGENYVVGDSLGAAPDDIGNVTGIIGSLGGINGGGFYTDSTTAQVTGSISGTVLTVTGVTSGPLLVGQTIYGSTIADNTTITSNGTGLTLTGVTITGTAGQFSCSSSVLVVGATLTISGTFGGTGSITGYSNPTSYLISATNGTTTFTLTTLSGAAIVTTAGTPTGLTYKQFGSTGTYNISTSQTIPSTTIYGLGVFRNTALTGGSGTGATANVVITGGQVSVVTIVNPGRNYKVGDSLTATFAGQVNGINTTTALVGGSNYTDGLFLNVPLTGGSGTGAKASILVSGNTVSQVVVTTPGKNYVIGNTLSAAAANIGNGINATSFVGGSNYADGVYVGVPLTGGSGLGATADITVSVGAVTSATINNRGVGYTAANVLSVDAANLGGVTNGIATFGAITAGSNYTNGTFTNIPLTGGAGTGATADITVAGNVVTAVVINNKGNNYVVGNTMSCDASRIGKGINTIGTINGGAGYTGNGVATLGTITGGSAYTNGTYTGVPLVSSTGTGSGAIATIVVSSNAVTSVTFVNPEDKGYGYKVADVLTADAADIGTTGSGFSVPVATVGVATFTDVSLIGGTGSAAKATIVVSTAGKVSSVSITSRGFGYAAANLMSANSTDIGGSGSGFSFPVSTVYNSTGFSVPVATRVTSSGFALTATTVFASSGFAVNVATLGTAGGFSVPVTSLVQSSGFQFLVQSIQESSGFEVEVASVYASSGFTVPVLTAENLFQVNRSGVETFTSLVAGSGYVDGTYTDVPLSNVTGDGIGGTVTVTVSGGVVTSVGLVNAGYGYSIGDQVTVANTHLGGAGSGFKITVATVTSVDLSTMWQFDTLYNVSGGENYLLAHPGLNLVDIDNNDDTAVFYGSINGTTMTPLKDSGGPNPTNQNIVVSGGVVSLHPYIFVYGDAGLIKNCSAGDPTDWNSADANEVNVATGKIVKGLPVRGGSNSPSGLFWSLDSLIRVSFIGGTGTPVQYWRYDLVSGQSSIMSSQCVIEYDGIYYWVGTDRFLMYNGVVKEIPNNMNQNWFFDNLNYNQRQKVWATKVPRFGEIWWFYPRGDATECNDAIVYNIRENTWYDMGQALGSHRSAGYFSQVFRYPVNASNDINATGGIYSISIVTAGSGYTDGVYPYIGIEGPVGSGATVTVTVSGGKVTKIKVNNKGTGYTSGNGFTCTIPGGSGFAGRIEVTCDFTSLWRHEFGTDEVFNVQSNAIESYFETNDLGWVSGGPSQSTPVGENKWLHVERVEPDFIQTGEMELYVTGRPYAQAEDKVSPAYPFDPDTHKIDMREQRREARLKFISNVSGGDYQVGKIIVSADFGDTRGY